MPRIYTTRPVAERFWEKTDRTDGPDACYPWTGRQTQDGYGKFGVTQSKTVRAHRMAWGLTNGPIPPGKQVLHNCPKGDNPLCCNPAHLWLGTNDENMADMVAKGRARRGERHGRAKFTNQQVQEIRDTPQEYGTASRLARQYGVHPRTIRRIIASETWDHIGPRCPTISAGGRPCGPPVTGPGGEGTPPPCGGPPPGGPP